MSHPLSGQQILFTQQRHEAKRMGLHYDYRLVLGDKAYSWASKKEVPKPGSAIILFEQPIHDRKYALSHTVNIPDGNYGAGVTYLQFARKATVDPETENDKLVINSGKERYLLKKLDNNKYGEKAWLFKNLSSDTMTKKSSTDGEHMTNKYLTKLASIHIKKQNKGLLHEKMGVPKGKKIGDAALNAELASAKKRGDVKEEREVVFAQNAKKWHHK